MEEASSCNKPRSFTRHHERLLWISRTLGEFQKPNKNQDKRPKYRGAFRYSTFRVDVDQHSSAAGAEAQGFIALFGTTKVMPWHKPLTMV
jgi:hypothetical protein